MLGKFMHLKKKNSAAKQLQLGTVQTHTSRRRQQCQGYLHSVHLLCISAHPQHLGSGQEPQDFTWVWLSLPPVSSSAASHLSRSGDSLPSRSYFLMRDMEILSSLFSGSVSSSLNRRLRV